MPKELVRGLLSRDTISHSILSGPLQGLQIVTSWHDYPGAILGTTERPLLGWLQSNVGRGETWLDVGAHYGYTAIALSRLVGEHGRVFAFEPVSRTAESLSRTRALNRLDNLTIVPLALSDSTSERTLRLPAVRGMADSTLAVTGQTEAIRSIALDAVWNSVAGEDQRIDGIKIDVQGMEVQVLAGMRDLLAIWRPKLVVEFHRGVERTCVLELLSSVDYAVEVDPVNPRDSGAFADDRSYVFSSR